jgi:hypothetical protein
VIEESQSMMAESKVEAFAPYHEVDDEWDTSGDRGFSKVNHILA